MRKFNEWLYAQSDRVGQGLGTPWTTLAFSLLAIAGTPGLFPDWIQAIAFWLAVSFIQLVMLPVLQTSGNRSAARLERLVLETHDMVISELQELKEINAELNRPTTTH